jgi:hypothetical protein
MKKLSLLAIIIGAALLSVAPVSVQWTPKKVGLYVDKAEARYGHYRRAYRRAYRRSYYGYGYGYGGYGYGGYGYGYPSAAYPPLGINWGAWGRW